MLATKLTTKEVETKLYDFFTEKMLHDELSDIENVQTFKEYLATYDTEYYRYDYSMGTLETPTPITDKEDLEDLIFFEGEE